MLESLGHGAVAQTPKKVFLAKIRCRLFNAEMAETIFGGTSAGSSGPESAWDVLKVITSSSADGITIQDAEGNLVYANDSAARMSGFASGQEMQAAPVAEIMARFQVLDEDGVAFPVDRLPGRRALLGEPDPQAVVRFRKRSGGRDAWALVRATPVLDDEGKIRHVVNVFVDITGERMRRAAESFLSEATKELARSLDWHETLQRVARLAVPTMADWCAVDILEPDGSLSLIAVEHVDASKVKWARELRERFPPGPADTTGTFNVSRTGVPELVPEITQAMIDAADIAEPELRDLVEKLQLSSVMYVPLVARGRTLGVLTMVWAESGNHYSTDDLSLAEQLASRAALAIDNARLYRERDLVAQSLQKRLLPKTLPQVPGLDVAARYLPAGDLLQAGGDFYDLFEMEDGSWKAVIGDVCGKGPEAAALMGFIRFTMRAVSRQDTKPSEALVKLNRALMEELQGGNGEFCTAAVVRINIQESGATLTVAMGGHPLPILLHKDGRLEDIGTPGPLLGVFDDVTFFDDISRLDPGDTLIMLTDGVLEAGRDEAWQDEILPEMLASWRDSAPAVIADAILELIAHVPERRTDDVAILVLQLKPADPRAEE